MRIVAILTAAAVTLSAMPALAYVGPGAGLSLLGAFWGLLLAVLAAVAFVVFYPIRRLMRGRKRTAEPARASAGEGSAREG